MEPNVTLAEIRELVADIMGGKYAIGDEPAHELAEKINDLDEWMSRAGFPPLDWYIGPKQE